MSLLCDTQCNWFFLCSIVTTVSLLSCHVKGVYIQTRFDIGEDTWPPEQPKDFTPVVLMYYEEQPTLEHATAITEALHTGDITHVISVDNGQLLPQPFAVDNHHVLREIHKTSKVTRNLADILVSLELSSSGPPTVLIEGAPGIGKSILMKNIAYNWAKGEMLVQYELLLLVCLRDPRIHTLSSIEELLQSFYEYRTDATSLTACAKIICQDNGKSLVLLLDGYDELPEDLRKNSLIASVLNRQVLPECGLIVSSRPHASLDLHNKATHQIVILGFTEKEQEHFIRQSLNNQPHKISQLIKHLQQHMMISSLCFTPFYMIVLLFLYKQGVLLPSNTTELYSLFICITICQNLAKYGITMTQTVTDLCDFPDPCDKIIEQLSKLSLHALNNNQLIFTSEQTKAFCPQIQDTPATINGFGLLQVVDHVGIFQKIRTFNFIHFLVQEFLAAYRVAHLPPQEELCVLEEYFWSGIHYNMFNIYIALTKGQSLPFKKFLCNGNDTILIDDKFLDKDFMKVRLYQCFYEAHDKRMCYIIEEKFCNKILCLAGTMLSPNVIQAITTSLTCSSIKHWRELQLSKCSIHDSGIRLLHRSLNGSGVVIDQIWLYNNGLTSSSDGLLCDIVNNCKVKVLGISENQGVGETDKLVAELLTHSSCVLETIHMSYNKYSTTTWVFQLFTSLMTNKSLKVLVIVGNNINDEACSIISKALTVNNTLRALYMWGNPISGEACQDIVGTLADNDRLQLLVLPKFNEGVTKTIFLLQKIVNEKRSNRGCNIKMEICFSK